MILRDPVGGHKAFSVDFFGGGFLRFSEQILAFLLTLWAVDGEIPNCLHLHVGKRSSCNVWLFAHAVFTKCWTLPILALEALSHMRKLFYFCTQSWCCLQKSRKWMRCSVKTSPLFIVFLFTFSVEKKITKWPQSVVNVFKKKHHIFGIGAIISFTNQIVLCCLCLRLSNTQNVNSSYCVGSPKQYQLCPNQVWSSSRTWGY